MMCNCAFTRAAEECLFPTFGMDLQSEAVLIQRLESQVPNRTLELQFSELLQHVIDLFPDFLPIE